MANTRRGVVEAAVVGVWLTAILFAVMWLSGTQSRLTHPTWLDECFASLLANDPSFAHMLAAIRGGVENNPPTFYLVLWPLARLFGGMSSVDLRLFAGMWMVVGLVGLYSICRLYFTRTQAMIGALAMAAHPMVVSQIFDARFYGAWLAATIWFAYSTMFRADEPASTALTVTRCVLAAVVATIHWFGIAAVALVVLADVIIARAGRRDLFRKALPLVSAGTAVMLCLPFLLGQRAGLTIATWIEPVTFLTAMRLAYRIVVNPSTFVLVGFVVLRLLTGSSRTTETWKSLRPLAPLISLLLFPFVIALFSIAVQPALLDRYVFLVVAPLAALTAAFALPASQRFANATNAMVIIGLVVADGREMRINRRLNAMADWRVKNAIIATERIIATEGPLPVLFVRRFEQYPLIEERPKLAPFVALLDFDGTPDSALMRRTLFERDAAREVSRYYPDHRLVNIATLREGGPFVVITNTNEEIELRRLLAGFDITLRAPDVFYVTP